MVRSVLDLVALVVSLAVAVAPVGALAEQQAPAPLDAPPPPPTTAPPPKATPAETPAPTPPPPPVSDAALEKRLDHAMSLMLADHFSDAEPILVTVAADAHDPELRGRALALLAFARARQKTPGQAERAAGPRAGRFPFVASSTLGGIAVGVEADLMLQSSSTPVNVSLVLLTTGAAFAASLLGTRHGDIREGEAVLYSDGMILGTYDGVLVGLLAHANGQATAGMALVGTVAGAGLGFLGGRALHLSPGAASLAGSGALWGTATGLALLGLIVPQNSDQTFGTLLAATNLGVAVGLAVGTQVPLSRSRVLLMDLGALLGGLTLGGIGLIVESGSNGTNGLKVVSVLALLGIYGGGALSLYLTRDLDAPSPGAGGGSLFSYQDGKVGVGVPLPEAMADPAHPGHLVMGLSLASGTLP